MERSSETVDGTVRRARHRVRELIEEVVLQELRTPGEDLDPELVDDLTAEQAYYLMSWADRYISAGKALRDQLRIVLAHDLGDGGAVRYGEDLVRYSRPNDWVLTPGFDYWAEENLTARDVLAILPRSGFRIGALRAVAERIGVDPKKIEGSLLVNRRDTNDPKVTVMSVHLDKAPKYAKAMEHGERRKGKKK